MNEYSKKKQGQRKNDLSFGQIQPQAPEVEKAVLGALMIDIHALRIRKTVLLMGRRHSEEKSEDRVRIEIISLKVMILSMFP